MQHTAHRKPGGGRRRNQPVGGIRLGDVAALHHDVGPDRPDELDCLQRFLSRLGVRAEHDPAAARRGHLLGEEKPEPTQAAGDDVGAVAAEDPSPFRRHHYAAAARARNVEDEFAGMFGRAHHPNRGGRLGQRVMGAVRHRQRALSGQPIHRVQHLADLTGMADRHQRQIHIKEREVAAEREEPQSGVAVDVTLADLDEPPTERQQSQPGQLRGAGHGVEHDVHAIPVGVTLDLLGELDAARVVDMLDTHGAQQCSALLATGRGEDLGSRGASDRDRRLPHATGCGVDQHLVTGLDPGQIVEPVPGGGVRGGHRGGLGVGQTRGQGRGQAGITGDEGAPATVWRTCPRHGRRLCAR